MTRFLVGLVLVALAVALVALGSASYGVWTAGYYAAQYPVYDACLTSFTEGTTLPDGYEVFEGCFCRGGWAYCRPDAPILVQASP